MFVYPSPLQSLVASIRIIRIQAIFLFPRIGDAVVWLHSNRLAFVFRISADLFDIRDDAVAGRADVVLGKALWRIDRRVLPHSPGLTRADFFDHAHINRIALGQRRAGVGQHRFIRLLRSLNRHRRHRERLIDSHFGDDSFSFPASLIMPLAIAPVHPGRALTWNCTPPSQLSAVTFVVAFDDVAARHKPCPNG